MSSVYSTHLLSLDMVILLPMDEALSVFRNRWESDCFLWKRNWIRIQNLLKMLTCATTPFFHIFYGYWWCQFVHESSLPSVSFSETTFWIWFIYILVVDRIFFTLDLFSHNLSIWLLRIFSYTLQDFILKHIFIINLQIQPCTSLKYLQLFV